MCDGLRVKDKNEQTEAKISESPWPKPGDKLFVPGNGRTTAYLGYRASSSVYAIGYKESADALIERVIEKDSGADLQFYSIAFLYRHYLELRLKELLISGGHVVYNESKLQHLHDLHNLWEPVRDILESITPDTYSAEMDALGKCIDELCILDAESMSFRYPVNKKGQPTLRGIERVELVNLKAVMERISAFLDAATPCAKSNCYP